MKLVNITDRVVYHSKAGGVNPGKTSSDIYHDMEKAMKAMVDACGKNFGLILNDAEVELLRKIIDLDEKGSHFDPKSIPSEIRRDPLGIERYMKREGKAQHDDLDRKSKANVDAAMHEAMINGESEGGRRIDPLKVNRKDSGERKDRKNIIESDDPIKTGFDAIMAENARIAAGDAGGNPVESPENALPEAEPEPEWIPEPDHAPDTETAGDPETGDPETAPESAPEAAPEAVPESAPEEEKAPKAKRTRAGRSKAK